MKKSNPPPGKQQIGAPARSGAAALARLQQAVQLHQQGRLAEAERLYQQVLVISPSQPDAVHFMGILKAQQGDTPGAAKLFERAIKIAPSNAACHANLAKAQIALGQPGKAVQSCDAALRLQPDFTEALFNRGIALLALKRASEAVGCFDRAALAAPQNAAVFYSRGLALLHLERLEEAIQNFETALQIHPQDADASYNRGTAQLQLGRLEAALASFDQTLQIRPAFAEAHNNRGTVLRKLNRAEEAIAAYDRALQIRPDDIGTLINIGTVLNDLDQKTQALGYFDRALQVSPQMPVALFNRGTILYDLKDHDAASQSFRTLLSVAPDYDYARGYMFLAQLHGCDWSDYTALDARIAAGIATGKRETPPFALLAHSMAPEDQLRCAQIYVADRYPLSPMPVWAGQRSQHDRIRIAYLSADFHNHATAYLMAGLFGLHDKSRFEIFAISFGPEGAGDMRQRLQRSFEHFIDVRQMSDRQIAQLLGDDEIDIAVDLKGFTADCRPAILAQRPAPIQVNYLGFPGTMGAPYIDYLIADTQVIPAGHDRFYAEKIIRLPDAYQVTDNQRPIAASRTSRAEAGLPEAGFVFCCFNNSYKISPQIFAIWMRLLTVVEGSVLWLLDDNPAAVRNLKKAAEQQGVSSHRLIFAPRIMPEEHLARHRLADLFLDTLPYTAHTTASDALWAGLPLVTCMGDGFAARVAGSLLQAIGLPELIASDLTAYESLAYELARYPSRLSEIKAKLADHRDRYPLFDTDRFRRHIEEAYVTMWQRHQNGEAPAASAVGAISG